MQAGETSCRRSCTRIGPVRAWHDHYSVIGALAEQLIALTKAQETIDKKLDKVLAAVGEVGELMRAAEASAQKREEMLATQVEALQETPSRR